MKDLNGLSIAKIAISTVRPSRSKAVTPLRTQEMGDGARKNRAFAFASQLRPTEFRSIGSRPVVTQSS